MTWGFHIVGPNEVIVKSGCFYKKPITKTGTKVFAIPGFQKIQKLSLNIFTIRIESKKIYTQHGVPISVRGVAQMGINNKDDSSLMRACEQFLSKSESEIINVAEQTLEAHQRAIISNMTVEDIYRNRVHFSMNVADIAKEDLENLGLWVYSFTLTDIMDEVGYLRALGLAQTEKIKSEARIGQAEAKCTEKTKLAKFNEEQKTVSLKCETQVAEAIKNFEVKKALFNQEIEKNKAVTDLTYDIKAAIVKQEITERDMEIKMENQMKEVELQDLQVKCQKNRLVAEVEKLAEAEKYRLQQEAVGDQAAIINHAEASAKRIEMIGEAEARAIKLKAEAEALKMQKRADAWREYEDAAKLELFLEALPKMVAEVSRPLCATKKITMVSSGDGPVGAAKLTGEVREIMEKLPKIVKSMTGLDIPQAIGLGEQTN